MLVSPRSSGLMLEKLMLEKTMLIRRNVPNRVLPIGTDVETGEAVSISLARLSEHVDVLGPTGVGKSQSVMLPLFEQLARIPDISVVAMTCKGSFAAMCADFAIGHGLTDKLVVFNPGQTPLVGFNPLRRNGWPAERHAKIARTAVLASRGEHSLDAMPQLARLLFLCLAVALEQDLTLVDAARLLRPGRSVLRNDMLRAVRSEFLRESLEWFNGLKDSRQEELAASTVGRLENFVGDPLIRAILTEQDRCLDVGDVIKNRKKLCIDLGFYSPLVPDDVRTMGRLILNNILAHKFATPPDERSPTVLLIDEVQEFATEDLAVALTLGREMKIFVVIAHQFPSQLKLGAEDSHLFEAVQECCRTKVLFGGMHVDELDGMVKELMIDQFNPLAVKDERTTLELEPVESTRETVTRGWSIGASKGTTKGTASAIARGKSRGNSRQWGASHSHSDALSLVHSSGVNSGMNEGETLLPTGEIIAVTSATNGASEVDTHGSTTVDAYGEFQAQGEQDTSSETETQGIQTGQGTSVSASWNQSSSRVPFYEYLRRRIVSSRTFWTLDEFLTVCMQKVKAQPRGHFVIKVPGEKAVFVRAPYIRVPWISNALRTQALARIAERSSLTRPAIPYQSAPLMLESTHPAALVPEIIRDDDLYQ
jgi:hypothetical protein